MNDKDYDELYGIDIDEYCLRHNTTIDELIRKSEIDIEILYENVDKLIEAERNGKTAYEDMHLLDTVSFTINKKYKHIQRLESWNANK